MCRIARGFLALSAQLFVAGVAAAQWPANQPILITPSSTSIQQGQALSVTGLACTSQRLILFDGNAIPFATLATDANTVQIQTAALTPQTYRVAMKCGDVISRETNVEVTVVKAVAKPSVTCAENRSPRDMKDSDEPDAKKQIVCAKDPESTTVRLEDTLALRVAGYSAWKAIPDNAARTPSLFIGGFELPNVKLQHSSIDANNHDVLQAILRFEGDASTEKARMTRENWAQLLRTSRSNWSRGLELPFEVSVGPAGGPQWTTTARVTINALPTGLTVFGVIVEALLLLVLGWAAVRTPLLRDRLSPTAPFSLAKCQMAIWFVVILGSYLYVTVMTGQAAATSTTALALIGISGATGLVAVGLDSRKRKLSADELRDLEAERTALTEMIDHGVTGLKVQLERATAASKEAEALQIAAMLEKKRERLTQVIERLDSKETPEPAKSQGLLTDILSDENGISLHRVQMLMWTVALVGAFVVAVWRTFAMAEFDATTLGLMGLSSGTYLGFKIPERTETSPADPKK